MRQAKQKNSSGDEFGAVLEIIRVHRANALVSVNVEHLLTNWEIGGYLSAKIKHDGWGKLSSQWLDKLLICQMCSRRLHKSFQCQMFSH